MDFFFEENYDPIKMQKATAPDRRRFQRNAVETLQKLLQVMNKQGLEPVEWTVLDSTALIARVAGPIEPREEIWTDWSIALGKLLTEASPPEDKRTSTGVRVLKGEWTTDHHPPIRIYLSARLGLLPDEGDDIMAVVPT